MNRSDMYELARAVKDFKEGRAECVVKISADLLADPAFDLDAAVRMIANEHFAQLPRRRSQP